MLGINGEFTGYGSTQWTQEVTTPVSTPNGVIPVGTYKSNASAFQYLFGPVVGVPIKKVSPFGQVLFGQTNTTLIATTSPSKMVRLAGMGHSIPLPWFGGGVDVSMNKRVAFRLAQLDWVLTRYTNPFTNTNNQNSFRYQGGIVIKFGGL